MMQKESSPCQHHAMIEQSVKGDFERLIERPISPLDELINSPIIGVVRDEVEALFHIGKHVESPSHGLSRQALKRYHHKVYIREWRAKRKAMLPSWVKGETAELQNEKGKHLPKAEAFERLAYARIHHLKVGLYNCCGMYSKCPSARHESMTDYDSVADAIRRRSEQAM